ncbi:TPA: hypothetical protein ACN976_004768 [Vibrio campbellii]
MEKLPLNDTRCPSMQIKLRSGLRIFLEQSDATELLIISIDPMFLSNLRAYIAREDMLEIAEFQKVEINKLLAMWENESYEWEEEAIYNIDEGYIALIKKHERGRRQSNL